MTDQESRIKFGKPILKLTYRNLIHISFITVLLNVVTLSYCIIIFSNAINIKLQVGDFINMVSKNDGGTLPLLLSIPAVLCLPMDVICIYLLYKAFSKKEQSTYNTIMYCTVLIGSGIVLLMIIICIMTLAHIYSSHKALHDNISDAMNSYNSDSRSKIQIDTLQIQFQCCGSKSYEEWYSIEWYDKKLIKNEKFSKQQTPFSCCSMKSNFLCIHHNIQSDQEVYRYSHDSNFSISAHGCSKAIKGIKVSVGWKIIGLLFLLMLLQLSITSGLRLVQTAHFRHKRLSTEVDSLYTCWLIGCYMGTVKSIVPPPVPPVPDELKR